MTEDLYDAPTNGEIEREIKSIDRQIEDLLLEKKYLEIMLKLNNAGRMEAMKIVYELSHTKKYMKKYNPDSSGDE